MHFLLEDHSALMVLLVDETHPSVFWNITEAITTFVFFIISYAACTVRSWSPLVVTCVTTVVMQFLEKTTSHH